MGYETKEELESVISYAHLLLELIHNEGETIPSGLQQRIEVDVYHISYRLRRYLVAFHNFQPRAFMEVARHVHPYYLTMLATRRDARYSWYVGLVGSQSNPTAQQAEPHDEISVDAYLTGTDGNNNDRLLEAIDDLAEAMGYDRPAETNVEFGSIFRRAKAAASAAFGSRELRERLAMVEQAVENHVYEERQAGINLTLAEAFERVMEGLRDQPEACVRVGSLLILKYQAEAGPVVLSRILSASEVQALERMPGIQKKPAQVLENLALAVANEGSRSGSTSS